MNSVVSLARVSRRELLIAVLVALVATWFLIAAASTTAARSTALPTLSHRGCIDPNGATVAGCEPLAAGVQIDPDGLTGPRAEGGRLDPNGLTGLIAAGIGMDPNGSSRLSHGNISHAPSRNHPFSTTRR